MATLFRESIWITLDGIDAEPDGGCEPLERTTVWNGYVDKGHVALNE